MVINRVYYTGTASWRAVRVDQRLNVDQDLIEFICNQNQTFRKHVQ